MKKIFLIMTVLAATALSAFTVSAGDDDLFLRKVVKDENGKVQTVEIIYNWDAPAIIYSTDMQKGKDVLPGRELLILDFIKTENVLPRSKAHLYIGESMKVLKVNVTPSQTVTKGQSLVLMEPSALIHDSVVKNTKKREGLGSIGSMLTNLFKSTGMYDVYHQTTADFANTWSLGLGRVIMIIIGVLLLYLAIFREFEPLLLLPIGFGAILANIPLAGISGPEGLLGILYSAGVETGIFPLLIFMGVGAMTDFGPLIANPKTAFLGAAAQFGIFTALLGALWLSKFGIDFDLKEAASIGIIGGADGPTAIFLASRLAPGLLGAIAVAAYSYMALVPIIQPPIMRALTTSDDRKIKMKQLRHVSKLEKVCFPIAITLLCALLLPSAAPLIGMLMFGNLMRESGVVERLSSTAQHALINIVTIFLGLSVGSKLSADKFLNMQTIGIISLGLIAFCIGTATGVLFGQVMKKLSGGKINPLIGAAGVSAVPMAARVVNKVGLDEDNHNFLLMHAMGPNVAGVIGSAVAAGVLLEALKHI